MNKQLPAQKRAGIDTWLWMLVVAPSRVVTLKSTLPPSEVLRRLKSEKLATRFLESNYVAVRLPGERNPRRFFAFIEQDAGNTTRLIGQMQTPFVTALVRVLLALFLLGMAYVWIAASRFWLGGIFVLGGLGFLLLSQYERVLGRDLRLHLDWLRRVLDADVLR